MSNSIFWNNIQQIIDEGFSSNGLNKMELYAGQFITQQLVYMRFSSFEQHGCAAGGIANVIATLLAGANVGTDTNDSFLNDFERECQCGKTREQRIEQWAKKARCWMDDVDVVLRNFRDRL